MAVTNYNTVIPYVNSDLNSATFDVWHAAATAQAAWHRQNISNLQARLQENVDANYSVRQALSSELNQAQAAQRALRDEIDNGERWYNQREVHNYDPGTPDQAARGVAISEQLLIAPDMSEVGAWLWRLLCVCRRNSWRMQLPMQNWLLTRAQKGNIQEQFPVFRSVRQLIKR